MNGTQTGSGERKLEAVISYILILGVIISLFCEVTGIVLFYRDFGSLAISHEKQMFLRGENFFTFVARLFSPSSERLSIRMITLGIAVLILTPYVRAILSVIYFAARENVKYFMVTLFVLTILTISLLTH